ncbi:MAG: hypothetical protein HOV81_45870 [Kofleriaceae bacterium]|nr:hypothetical protein [Kofleriaceae bacterium]
MVTFFEDDGEFLSIVTDFVKAGLDAGDSVVVVATGEHLAKLDIEYARLQIDVKAAELVGRYIQLDTNDVYPTLLSQGWPDQDCFDTVMAEVLQRGRMPGRVVRCIGEIVAVVWARGEHAATIRLEHMWKKLVDVEHMVILCMYPRRAFERDMAFGLQEVVRTHSIVKH